MKDIKNVTTYNPSNLNTTALMPKTCRKKSQKDKEAVKPKISQQELDSIIERIKE